MHHAAAWLDLFYAEFFVGDHYYVCRSPEDIHILVAGGPGKHSAFIPSFGGTAAASQRVTSL